MIDGPRLEALNGTAKSLVIFLHGYGADGNDLIGIGREWQRALPDTAFVSPHAPEACEQAPSGRQWFGFTVRNAEQRWRGVSGAAGGLDDFITGEMERHGLPASKIALVGFSQGTMMALHVALRRREALGAVIGYSGTIAGPEHLKAELASRPPIFLAHGTQDQVIPIDALVLTVETLARAGLDCEWHVAHGVAHGIDGAGLTKGGDFLARYLR